MTGLKSGDWIVNPVTGLKDIDSDRFAYILDSKADTSTCKAANAAGHFCFGLYPALMNVDPG
jgi:hypothetical protein